MEDQALACLRCNLMHWSSVSSEGANLMWQAFMLCWRWGRQLCFKL